jgi:hypothetical protein
MYSRIKNYILDKIKTEKKINSNTIMENLLSHYDKNKTILQGKYLRDNVGLYEIINLFIKLMDMEIIFQTWCFHDMFEKKEFEKNEKLVSNLNLFLSEKIKNLNENGFYVILVEIPYHVNLIFIDKRKKYKWKYYFYEPHMPEKYNERYEFIKYVNNMFDSNGYVLCKLPTFILRQKDLPLCYIYVLHSILCLYALHNDVKVNNEIENNDSLIINFTEKILNLCHTKKLIQDLDYHILSDNISKINNKILRQDIFLLSCNPNVIVNIFENNSDLHIMYDIIQDLYEEELDFKYFDDIISLVSKSQNITKQQKNEFYILELLLKNVYNVNITKSLYKYYDDMIFYNIIYDEDILAMHYENYVFCLKIFNIIKNRYKIRNIIYKQYSSGDLYSIIKTKCDKKFINLIDRKINQKRERE